NVGHAVRLRDDDVQKAVGGLHRDVPLRVPQGLGIAADVGEGGAQLVGDIGHELLAPLLVAVLLRHVMKHHQHAAAGLVGKRRQKQLQRPVPHLHLRLGVVGSLEGQGLLEGIDLTEEGIVGSALRHTAVEHVGGGGIAVDKEAVVVKGHHAVGHVEEQGVQLVPLVLHGGQRGLKDIGHLVEGAREDADLVSGLHGELAVKVSRGHPLCPGGELFDGAHHGLGQQEAQQDRDQQADHQRLHDDEEELGVQVRHCVLVVQDVNDVGVSAPHDGDGCVHIVGGDVAAVSH
ncbi:EamA family transporter, partial [Dysosmobacter welbionis]